MTSSRLLESLLSQAQSTRDRLDWARTVCRVAAHQARTGRHAAALVSLGQVRKVFGPGLHPDVASWLMLSEGILHSCQFNVPAAYDRMMRAHVLAVGFGNTKAIPSCAAWMAALEFDAGRYDKMVEHLDQAFTLADPEDHQARSRAALTFAEACHVSGGYALARPWYEECRRHATSEGDEATLGAMLFNVALFRLVTIRLAGAFGERSESEVLRASLEATGSVSFDLMTGNTNQEPLRWVLQSIQQLVEGKYETALATCERLDVPNTISAHILVVSFADRAWCLLNLGRLDEAKCLAEEVVARFDTLSDTDDQAYALARLAQIAEACGLTDEAHTRWAQAQEAYKKHQAFQAELQTRLSTVRAKATK